MYESNAYLVGLHGWGVAILTISRSVVSWTSSRSHPKTSYKLTAASEGSPKR